MTQLLDRYTNILDGLRIAAVYATDANDVARVRIALGDLNVLVGQVRQEAAAAGWDGTATECNDLLDDMQTIVEALNAR